MEIKYDVLGRYGEFGSARTVIKDGIKWYCANDILKILEYHEESYRNALRRHCRNVVQFKIPVSNNKKVGVDPTRTSLMSTSIYYKDANFINRNDIFRLLDHSPMPKAEEFREWLFDDVIPSIEYTGAYVDPEALNEIKIDPIKFIKKYEDNKIQLNQYKETIKELQSTIGDQQVKLNLAEKYLSEDSLHDINLAADAVDILEMKELQLHQLKEENVYLRRELNQSQSAYNSLSWLTSIFEHPELIKPNSKPLIRFMD